MRREATTQERILAAIGAPAESVAERLGISVETVHRARQAAGANTHDGRLRGDAGIARRAQSIAPWVVRQVATHTHMSPVKAALKIGCSPHDVRAARRVLGVDEQTGL